VVDGLIDVSDIVQYLFCPRKVYFLKVHGVRITRPKMEYGRELHSKVKRVLKRLEGEVQENVYLESMKYGIRGCIDAVLKKGDDYIPIDVKYSKFKDVFYRWKMQLVAYAVLIEENYNCRVKQGLIYLIQDRKWIEVKIFPEDKKRLKDIIVKVEKLIEDGSYPPAAKSKKCNYCEVAKFCV